MLRYRLVGVVVWSFAEDVDDRRVEEEGLAPDSEERFCLEVEWANLDGVLESLDGV